MAWTIEWDRRARRVLRKLDRSAQAAIVRYLNERVAPAADPKQFGKPLQRKLRGLWSYRIGDYRAVCRIDEGRLVVLVVEVGHRSRIYERR